MDTPTQPPQFATAEFEPELADSHGLFVRGVLFGAGGALLGLALYSAVGIITGYIIGFVSLAVGWIVGKSILFGSKGRTGRRYQIAALALTYAAVSLSAVPVAIAYAIKAERELAAAGATVGGANPLAEANRPAGAPAGAGIPEDAELEPISFWPALGQLVWLGLSSPFLELQDMPGGLISLFILAIGLQIAWKMTGSQQAAIQEVLAPARATEEKPTSLDLNR